MTDPRPLDVLRTDDFLGRRGETFRLHSPDGAQDVVLIEVTPLGAVTEAPTGRQGAFSLVFRGAPGVGHVPQAIYCLEHDELGSLEVFLVPIGPRDGGMCYEAVFN